jgi:hypothetical protein
MHQLSEAYPHPLAVFIKASVLAWIFLSIEFVPWFIQGVALSRYFHKQLLLSQAIERPASGADRPMFGRIAG